MRRGEGSAYARNAPSKRAKKPTALDKQATVYAAPRSVFIPPALTPSQPQAKKAAPSERDYKLALGRPVRVDVKHQPKNVADVVPPPRHRDTSFLHALERTPGSVAHNLFGYGKTAAKATEYTAKQATGQGTYKKRSFGSALQLPAKQLGGPALYNAVTQGQTSHLGAAAAELALLPFPLKGLRALRAGARESPLAARVLEHTRLPEGATAKPIPATGETSSLTAGAKMLAARGRAPAPKLIPVKREPIGGHVYPDVSLEEMHKTMPTGDHLYHSTSGSSLGQIAKEGLKPGKVRPGEPVGVYLAESGVDVLGLRPRGARRNDVWLRVRRDKVATEITDMFETGSGFAEHVSPKTVPASAIEYYGADNVWHPLSEYGRKRVGAKGYSTVPELRPKVEPTPLEQGAKEVMGGMGQATKIRREQEALRKVERAKRAHEAGKLLETIPGEEGLAAARRAMAGTLPTLRWGRFTEMNHETIAAMDKAIVDHPGFRDRPHDLANTKQALYKITSGHLPTKSEQRLLRSVFGDIATKDMVGSVGDWKWLTDRGLNVIGVPRTLLASLDMSAPLRQGLVFGVTHPVLWGRNFPKMIKSWGSTAIYDEIQREILSRSNFDLYQRMRVPFTDLRNSVEKREEQFMSSYAETITGGKYSFVRASNRSYVAFLNKSRADYADWLVEQVKHYHPELDLDSPEADKLLEQMGRVIGNATGRGTVKHFEEAMPLINQLFFAPRLFKSRLDVLAYPATMWKMDPLVRREAFKQLAALVGTVGGVLTLAKLAGARVTQDPTSADWAKIRIGNTRFDIAAGFQQPVRLLAQVSQGKITSSTTGKTISLNAAGQYGKLTKRDIIQRFGETKLSPPVSFLNDYFRGSDFTGQPFEIKNALYQRLTPLLAQDAYDFYKQGDTTAGNIAAVTALYGVGFWGVGAQTYGPKPKAKYAPKSRDYTAPSTDGSDYARSSGQTSDYLRRTP